MPTASLRIVSPEYFQMMKIPILDGRPFDNRDTATSPEVVLINERAARRFFSGQNPVGQQIRVGAELARDARNEPKAIVGVVGDIKYGGLDEDTPAEIYLPYEQHPVDAFMSLCARRGIASPPLPRCGMTWPDSIHCSRSPISRDSQRSSMRRSLNGVSQCS